MAGRKVLISAMHYIRRQPYTGYSGELSLKEHMMANKHMEWSRRCELSHDIALEFQARESLPNEALSVVVKHGKPVLKPLLSPNSSHFPFIKHPYSEPLLPANQIKQCSMSIAQVLTGLPPFADSESNLVERLISHLIKRRGNEHSLHEQYGPKAGELVLEFYEAIKFVVLCYDFTKVDRVCKRLSGKKLAEANAKFREMNLAGMAEHFNS